MATILTIDDEVEFTNLIQGYFGARGFKVLTANEGHSGIAIAKQNMPEIYLIDLKMPGMHGDEVMKQVLGFQPTAKIIMITASEGEGKTRSKLIEEGAYTCFDKPLTSLRDLEATIKEVLGK